MPLLTSAIAVAIIVGLLAIAGCGDGEDQNSTFDLTPEEVQAKLLDRGFVTGEIITDGANVGVARGGKLDANAYLGVDATPEGEPLYVGIYFFDSAADATTLAKERTEDRDFHTEVIGDMEFEIAGSSGDLFRVIAAVQAPE
jgi:hypothetical protein